MIKMANVLTIQDHSNANVILVTLEMDLNAQVGFSKILIDNEECVGKLECKQVNFLSKQ